MSANPAADVVGEVALDSDGVLHGWCWCPDRPAERLTVDILVEDETIATVVASRFREDVRNRHYGDGYHGFTVSLTAQLARRPGAMRVRERVSGRVFWQKFGTDVALPNDFETRLTVAAGMIRGAAVALEEPHRSPPRFAAAAFGAAGRHLRGGLLAGDDMPMLTLMPIRRPRFSVILTAGGAANATFGLIAAAARALASVGAEVILLDNGEDPRMLLLASRVRNLRYLRAAAATEPRNAAARAAQGEVLVFLQDQGRRFDRGLLALPRHGNLALLLGAGNAAATTLGSCLDELPPQPFLGLELAIGTAAFRAAGGFKNGRMSGETLRDCLGGRRGGVWRETFTRGRAGADGSEEALVF